MVRTETGIDGLHRLLARTADGVCAIDAGGKIVLWNRAAERITGYPAREVLGRSCCDVFAGSDDHGNKLCYPGCQVQTLARGAEPVENLDMRLLTRARRPLWINVSILAAAPGPGAPPYAIVHLFRDVTATKELFRLIHERLATANGAGDGAAAGTLTRRELEVLRLLATGGNTRSIAEQLHVSRATVRNHVQNICGKLGVHSRLEAVAWINRHRLL